jgi:helicase
MSRRCSLAWLRQASRSTQPATTTENHETRVIRLVDVLRPLTAPPNSTTLIAAAQVTRELDDVYFPFHRRATRTEHQRWPMELAQQQVAASVQNLLGIGGSDHLTRVARAKKAVACLLYASDMPLSTIERHLTQHQREDGGVAGAIRQTADRTRDLVPAVVRVFEFLHPDSGIGDIAQRTTVRLELGVPAELAELGTILGSALTRAQVFVPVQSRGHGTGPVRKPRRDSPIELLGDA